MKRITLSQLNKLAACTDGVAWFVEHFKESADSKAVFATLIKAGKLDWANWLIVRLLSHKNQIRYAIYAAEQVLGIYEKQYPDDDRPREAIKAAELVLKRNTKKNRVAANAAAKAAANAAANAAYAAADAAYAAAYTANAAANATDAANAAAYAAMKEKIIRYGLLGI